MKRDENSKGRKKKVTSGSGKVYKRGDGLNSSKPVGGKRESSKPSGSSSNNKGSSYDVGSLFQGASNGSSSGGLSLKKLIRLIIIVAIVFFVYKTFFAPTNGGFDLSSLVSEYTESSDTVSTSVASNEGELNTIVSNDARDKRTQILGDGEDVYTIMIYMCGTDLESNYGMATSDINEMLSAEISDKVNIIIETGGTKKWKNSVVSNSTNQRYQATSEGLVLIEDNLGKRAMTDPATLTDFITYAKEEFPASRYSLILWDHGGGSNQGYGYDELSPGTTMTLAEIDDALKDADCQFDFVGFDACLMATYETAIMLDPYADYLIASEETEPGIGWYYTDWITQLSQNTSMDTINIGKNIIDDFVEKCYESSRKDKTTLSIVDLAELSGTVPEAFNDFASSTAELINAENYQVVSEARGGAREFGEPSQLNQIDLVDFAQQINTAEANEFVSALQQCIKYNRTSNTISNANGLSIYFPFQQLSTVGDMLDTYDEIGMDSEYSNCIKDFANLEVGGQVISGGSDNALGSLLGEVSSSIDMETVASLLMQFVGDADFSSILGDTTSSTDWIDSDKITESTEYLENNYISSDMALTAKNDGYVLSMTDEDWELVQTANLNVFFDDGEGYIDLGLDNVYEFDEDGDLVITFDGTWIAINGQVVSYYYMSGTVDDTITGRVPILLNGDRFDLILVFTEEDPYGEVLGARIIYENEESSVAKGLVELQDGDVIDFICDYYTYDDEFDDSYFIGDQMIVDGILDISNVDVGDADCKVTYKLIDIYNNSYWTPALTFGVE